MSALTHQLAAVWGVARQMQLQSCDDILATMEGLLGNFQVRLTAMNACMHRVSRAAPVAAAG